MFVCGPPGSGKTSYCQQHAVKKDIIWDLDAVAACLNPHYEKNKNRSPALNRILGSWRDSLVTAIQDVQITNDAYVIITDPRLAISLAKKTPRSSVTELKKDETGMGTTAVSVRIT